MLPIVLSFPLMKILSVNAKFSQTLRLPSLFFDLMNVKLFFTWVYCVDKVFETACNEI